MLTNCWQRPIGKLNGKPEKVIICNIWIQLFEVLYIKNIFIFFTVLICTKLRYSQIPTFFVHCWCTNVSSQSETAVNLTGLSVLLLVRFDQNAGWRLLPETCFPQPRPEWELHSALQSPASHPLQEPSGPADRAEEPTEKIHGPISSQLTRALSHRESWELHKAARRARLHPQRASPQQTSPQQPSQWLQTWGEAEATLLRETEEMYVRAISHFNPHLALWQTPPVHA